MPAVSTTHQEDIHTPNPLPARGIYGFALYLAGWIGLFAYLVWAFVPTPWLRSVGVTYLPAKYWAVAVPLLFPVLVVTFVIVIFSINLYRFHGIFEDVAVVENDFSDDNAIVKAEEKKEEGFKKASASAKMLKRMLLCTQLRLMSRHDRMRQSIPRKVPSRSDKIDEISRRFMEFELDQKSGAEEEKKRRAEFLSDSLAAELHIQKHSEQYKAVLERRKKVEGELKMRRQKQKADFAKLPLSASSKSVLAERKKEVAEEEEMMIEEKSPEVRDRGFFVDSDRYHDEYKAGVTWELPDDEMAESEVLVFGDEDSIERIEFQQPHQPTNPKEREGLEVKEEEVEMETNYATIDPSLPVSDLSCAGCGAHFHCKDSSLPGFVPLEVLFKVESRKRKTQVHNQLCRRCYLLKHHNFLLNVNVCPVDYASMMSRLRTLDEVLVLLVLDVTDLPGSIHRELPKLIGRGKPMIVAVNKVDLLPPDARCGYLKRVKMSVEKVVRDAGFHDAFNILHTALVSAKTGYGIEDLITEIHMKWTNIGLDVRDDIYLVGCTNTGKSSMFNTLLRSDLCKVRAVDAVERATTSPWPGTTLSLLKFPIMHPSPIRLELRRRRLLAGKAWLKKEMYARKLALQRTGDSDFAVLQENVENTYKRKTEEMQPVSLQELMGEEGAKPKKLDWNPNEEEFKFGAWCYDTPGTVNGEQLIGELHLEEIVRALPRRLLRPRTARVKPGQSLLLGAIARVDVLGETRERGEKGILLTTFASDGLPLNIVDTDKVSDFLKKFAGTEALGVPLGGEERLSKLPPLEYKEFMVEKTPSEDEGEMDLVLSSFGWMLVSSSRKALVRVFTPGGRGIALRSPPLLPFSAALRGPRIPGTQFYKVRPVEFPVNERRKKAGRNKQKARGQKEEEVEATDVL